MYFSALSNTFLPSLIGQNVACYRYGVIRIRTSLVTGLQRCHECLALFSLKWLRFSFSQPPRRYEHGGSTAGTAVFSGYFDLPVERGKEDGDARAPVDKKNAHSDSALLLAPNRSSSMWFESSVLLE